MAECGRFRKKFEELKGKIFNGSFGIYDRTSSHIIGNRLVKVLKTNKALSLAQLQTIELIAQRVKALGNSYDATDHHPLKNKLAKRIAKFQMPPTAAAPQSPAHSPVAASHPSKTVSTNSPDQQLADNTQANKKTTDQDPDSTSTVQALPSYAEPHPAAPTVTWEQTTIKLLKWSVPAVLAVTGVVLASKYFSVPTPEIIPAGELGSCPVEPLLIADKPANTMPNNVCWLTDKPLNNVCALTENHTSQNQTTAEAIADLVHLDENLPRLPLPWSMYNATDLPNSPTVTTQPKTAMPTSFPATNQSSLNVHYLCGEQLNEQINRLTAKKEKHHKKFNQLSAQNSALMEQNNNLTKQNSQLVEKVLTATTPMLDRLAQAHLEEENTRLQDQITQLETNNQQCLHEKYKLTKLNGKLIEQVGSLTESIEEIKYVLSPSYFSLAQEMIGNFCSFLRWPAAAAIVIYAKTHPASALNRPIGF